MRGVQAVTDPALTLDGERAVTSAAPAPLAAMAERALPWIAALVALVVGLAVLDASPVGVFYDDGMYVVLAKSLATGHGYRWLNLPGAPPATHFPPGYPAVLAVLWWIFPSFPANVLAFKAANACFNAVSAFLLVGFTRDRWHFHPVLALAFAIFTMIGIPVLTLSSLVLSEPLFLMLVLLALRRAERVVEEGRGGAWDLVGLGLLAGAIANVRTQGIVLVAGAAFVLAARRRWRDAALFALAAVLVLLPWQLWVATHAGVVPPAMSGNYESYGHWLAVGLRDQGVALLWRAAAKTIPTIVGMFAVLAAPSAPALARHLALLVIGACVLLGLRPLARRAPVLTLFLLFYFAITVVWPFAPTRFVWCIWPLALLPAILGARECFHWRPQPAALCGLRVVGLAGASLVLLGHAAYTRRGYAGHWWASIARRGGEGLRPLVIWARERTSPDAVLAVEAESTVYLYTGRLAVPIQPFTAEEYFAKRTAAENAEALRQILAAYPVDAVAAGSRDAQQAARLLAMSSPPALAVVDTFPGELVLRPTGR